jgi:hypothetical protein
MKTIDELSKGDLTKYPHIKAIFPSGEVRTAHDAKWLAPYTTRTGEAFGCNPLYLHVRDEREFTLLKLAIEVLKASKKNVGWIKAHSAGSTEQMQRV